MASIESLNAPLAYKADGLEPQVPAGESPPSIVVKARSLEGMQKEAVVENIRTGDVWRMACDEGPYLNGSDLAPFQLAFFTAGMAISITSNLRMLAGLGLPAPEPSQRVLADAERRVRSTRNGSAGPTGRLDSAGTNIRPGRADGPELVDRPACKTRVR